MGWQTEFLVLTVAATDFDCGFQTLQESDARLTAFQVAFQFPAVSNRKGPIQVV